MTVQFAKPVIGPRAYVSVGTSGWPETFVRCDADRAARDFVKPLELETVLENFLDGQRVIRSEHRYHKTNWSDVIEYLARLKGIGTNSITGIVGVGFWGLSILAEAASEN